MEYSTKKELTQKLSHEIAGRILQFWNDNQSENSRTIQLVLDYIAANYQNSIRLEDAAEQVYLAPAYLGILFKKETGENFSAYVTNVRIEKAKELLLDVRLNVGEIAGYVGYNNVRYFSRVFKEKVGITPKEYRKIHVGKRR